MESGKWKVESFNGCEMSSWWFGVDNAGMGKVHIRKEGVLASPSLTTPFFLILWVLEGRGRLVGIT